MAGAVGDDAVASIALQNLQGEVDIRRVVRSKEPTGSAAIMIDALAGFEIVTCRAVWLSHYDRPASLRPRP